MELLNLDTLVTTTRKVSIGGTEYAVAQQTVGMMVDAIEAAKLVANGDQGDEMFLRMVDTCRSILPEAPEGVIRSMNFQQMTALIEFATATDDDAIAASEPEVEGEEGEEGKP